MNHRKALWITLILSLFSVISWEVSWRSKGRIPDLSDDKFLWAEKRAQVENLDKNSVVIIGSSRVLFNLQLPEWEKLTGTKPIQLATAGGHAVPVLEDIVKNTDYSGTLIVGVTPGIFFSKPSKESRSWGRTQKRVDYYHKRTYADRLNHFLSIPLQNNLAFLSAAENEWADDIDLKSLLRATKWGVRTGRENDPPFNSFQYLDIDRNTRMSHKCAHDTAFTNTVKRVWKFHNEKAKKSPKDEAVLYVEKLVKKFEDRGGNLIFLQSPSTGFYKEQEAKNQPREEFWDVLIQKTGVKGYHYEDYESLKNFDCPEWSHLSGEDADRFTHAFLNILRKDNVLPQPENQ
ncbi:MAG: hypothetical protein IPL63_11750 [Saprospiraceae bacterium]|nr:hypothetical protein [Saprospiraceae bacterium]MBK9044121.1 hypothetical protein [Saprospiraceae bacterium]